MSQAKAKWNLCLGNIGEMMKKEIEAHLKEIGVRGVQIKVAFVHISHNNTNVHKGWALLVFKKRENYDQAFNDLNGNTLGGHKIDVRDATEEEINYFKPNKRKKKDTKTTFKRPIRPNHRCLRQALKPFDKNMILYSVNFEYILDRDEPIPCEIAISRFTINDGELAHIHTFIDPLKEFEDNDSENGLNSQFLKGNQIDFTILYAKVRQFLTEYSVSPLILSRFPQLSQKCFDWLAEKGQQLNVFIDIALHTDILDYMFYLYSDLKAPEYEFSHQYNKKKCLMHNDLHPKYNCALATSRQCGAILIHAAFFHLELIGEYEEYNTVNSIDNIEVDIQSLKDKIIHKKKKN